MRPEDLDKIVEKMSSWKNDGKINQINNVLVCSPAVAADGREEISTYRNVFPNSSILGTCIQDWDISKSSCPVQSDLLIASGVFLCAHDPFTWIENARKNTRYFVLQDHCISKRGGPGEISPETGDVMRFTMPPFMVAEFKNAYDLNAHIKDIIEIEPYILRVTSRMFVCLFKGCL